MYIHFLGAFKNIITKLQKQLAKTKLERKEFFPLNLSFLPWISVQNLCNYDVISMIAFFMIWMLQANCFEEQCFYRVDIYFFASFLDYFLNGMGRNQPFSVLFFWLLFLKSFCYDNFFLWNSPKSWQNSGYRNRANNGRDFNSKKFLSPEVTI